MGEEIKHSFLFWVGLHCQALLCPLNLWANEGLTHVQKERSQFLWVPDSVALVQNAWYNYVRMFMLLLAIIGQVSPEMSLKTGGPRADTGHLTLRCIKGQH